MSKKVVLLSIPGLRHQDYDRMPSLKACMNGGSMATVSHSFPCVTWPSQANVLTGKLPNEHGVVANGFFWRDNKNVEMWTAWNEVISAPQIWDVLKTLDTPKTSAAWFPMLSKGCGAEYVCMPAPIHRPDGSEDLWCYTKPQEFYGELLEEFGHFPLQHFWGPLANIKSTNWIADSAIVANEKFNPDFFYIYLPHLDYAAQKTGPDSDSAKQAVIELDQTISRLISGFESSSDAPIHWMAVSEYTIVPVDHVCFPNRILRDAGLLTTRLEHDNQVIDFENSEAWALVDHQFSHLFLREPTDTNISKVSSLFANQQGIETVMSREQRSRYAMNHQRSGDIILISSSNSWQAYYWWNDDNEAPDFAHQVDIHRKPGYDPVELHFDFDTKRVPLDASLIKGSHGAPAVSPDQMGIFVTSESVGIEEQLDDVKIFDIVINEFK